MSRSRVWVNAIRGAAAGLALAASTGCSDGTGEAATGSEMSSGGTEQASGAAGSGVTGSFTGVSDYDRPPGMPIGRGGASGESGEETPTPDLLVGSEPAPIEPDPGELAIPVFEPPPPDAPPCSGCVELTALINNPNQRSDFAIELGGVPITRVVWDIVVPFNSDQLFIRSFVNGTDGTYTFLDANRFTVDQPELLEQTFTGTATTVGLAFGSAGAWTGNAPISLFVTSVTLEGADPSASRTFDAGPEGFTARGTERDPRVTFHP